MHDYLLDKSQECDMNAPNRIAPVMEMVVRKLGMSISVGVCVAPLIIASAQAANMGASFDDGSTYITIEGEIVEGDSAQFKRITQTVSGQAFVVLHSNGGSAIEAMEIGETIRARGYATAVINGNQCASACGLIWLAGTPRYVGTTAHVGFHAAYHLEGEAARESGAVNALIGAYVTNLGLSYGAVLFVTSSPPTQMKWMHSSDTEKLGIQVVTISDPKPEQVPPPAHASEQVLPDGSPLEHRAMNLILAYYKAWSGSTTNVDDLVRFYDLTVSFYGTNVSRAKVMDEKIKYSQRWPIRQYTVRSSTMYATCSDTCSVSGVVEWDFSSVERDAHSTGAANFVYKINPVGDVIVSENGAVLSHATPVLSSQVTLPSTDASVVTKQQASSVAYGEGRLARITYENWFATLTDGPFREGVVFWTSNRSLKVPPTCTEASGNVDWRQGCTTARTWFATVDRRRKTEKDYWCGWNSL
jgi:hypothetical protein